MLDNSPQEWMFPNADGQLSVDVFREGDCLLIRTTVAGAQLDDIDIAISGDLLTIRGERRMPEVVNDEDWFSRECYWGPFSRSLILPLDAYTERAQATLKDGVLTVTIPLRTTEHRLHIEKLESFGV